MDKYYINLAYEGKLPIWGKRSENDIWHNVPQEFWKNNRLDWFSLLKGIPERLTFMRNELKTEKWLHLMTSRTVVEHLWSMNNPPASSGVVHSEQKNPKMATLTLFQ